MIVYKDSKVIKIYNSNQKFIEFLKLGNNTIFESPFTYELNIGVVICYDVKLNSKIGIKVHKISEVDLSRYVPICIVVNKIDHRHALCVSLYCMNIDNPATGINNTSSTMYWGPSLTVGDIPNTKNEDEALDDFDGRDHTNAIISKRGSKNYDTWKPSNILASSTYPAASCCDMFYTEGTNQGDWYLPACGELNYLIENFDVINRSLIILNNLGYACVTLNENATYWSSSDRGTLYAWDINPSKSKIDYNNKVTNKYNVRAYIDISI